jgi:hypothetical protein
MKDIICWWSGGITSAVACKIAIDLYGKDRCRAVMIDTANEHEDTYRFLSDCEKWYGIEIETISAIGKDYDSIQDVWRKHLSLNVASGAVCSYKLKRVVREKWQKDNDYSYQVFGFEFMTKEFKRALALSLNHPKAKPIYPLMMMAYDKEDCLKIVNEANIDIPEAYKMGFQNNNCLQTGCISGGIGYWKKMQSEYPEKFNAMANMEHYLSNAKASPVTCLKDQSNDAKAKKKITKFADLVFLKKHPEFPGNKCLDDMRGRPVEPLVDCNGLCGVGDLI